MRVMAKPLGLVQEGMVLRWLYLGANDVTVVAVLNGELTISRSYTDTPQQRICSLHLGSSLRLQLLRTIRLTWFEQLPRISDRHLVSYSRSAFCIKNHLHGPLQRQQLSPRILII